MEILNAREWAIALWTLACFGLLLNLRVVRESVWSLVGQALFSKLFIVWLSLAAYALLLVLWLRYIGLWRSDLLKDTLVWFLFCALAYPLQFHDAGRQSRILRTLLRDSISVLIILEVLIDTYVFSLWIELILIPVVTLISVVGAVAELGKRGQPVAEFLRKVQAIIGLALVTSVVWRAATDPTHGFIDTLLSSLIVVVLSVACWPYINILRIVLAHQKMLWRIGRKKNVSKAFKHYAAFRVLQHLKFRPTKVPAFICRNSRRLSDIVDRKSLKRLLNVDRVEICDGDQRA